MGLSFYTGATGFLGRNLLGALLRETRDDYLVLIRSEKSREIIERHVSADCLDRITYVMGGLRRPGYCITKGCAPVMDIIRTFGAVGIIPDGNPLAPLEHIARGVLRRVVRSIRAASVSSRRGCP